MSGAKYTLTIVDILVGFAVLMILAGLFAPHFLFPARTGKAAQPAQAVAVKPAR